MYFCCFNFLKENYAFLRDRLRPAVEGLIDEEGAEGEAEHGVCIGDAQPPPVL